MVVAITGITGLLGRNILFELFRLHRHNLPELTVLAFGKAEGGLSLQGRIREMLEQDGRHYLQTSDVAPFAERAVCINWQLGEKGLGLSPQDIKTLRSYRIGLFIHAAATVDFRDSPMVRETLHRINVEGTKEVIALCEGLDIAQFVYVGTAYSCGKREGRIAPGLVDFGVEFRNPYERSKLEGEVLVREAGARGKLPGLKIFRPSTICGRLLEPLPGQVSKFDIFYAWLAFFLRLKAKELGRIDYEQTTRLDIRVCFNPHAGLNVVPADYAAKALLAVAASGTAEQGFHLAAPRESANSTGIPLMFDFIKVALPPFVDSIPGERTPLERLYYEKSVGRIYTPYISSNTMDFDVGSLHAHLPEGFPECPPAEGGNLATLLGYARQHNFGLE